MKRAGFVFMATGQARRVAQHENPQGATGTRSVHRPSLSASASLLVPFRLCSLDPTAAGRHGAADASLSEESWAALRSQVPLPLHGHGGRIVGDVVNHQGEGDHTPPLRVYTHAAQA
jgi:hypothetical protein